MTSWLLLAIGAQLMLAAVSFIDRFILTHPRGVPRPLVYAFYVSILSGFVIVLIPFGVVSWPDSGVLQLSAISAAAFIGALLLLYRSFKAATASDVMPVVAAASAAVSFILAGLILDEGLPRLFIAAILLFIIGTFLISRYRFTRRSFLFVIGAGILFGISTFVHKPLFLITPFWDGFFWSRMANVVGAFALLSWPGHYALIMHSTRAASHSTKWLVVGNKTLSGIAGAMTFFAIALGSVSVVNAMAGLQFVFLLLLAFLFSKQLPQALKGEFEKKGLTHKLAGITCIIVGLALLFIR